MPLPPPITVGLNKYTPGLWGRHSRMLCWFEQNRGAIESLLQEARRPTALTTITAVLTGYQNISANRWRYAWVQAWQDVSEETHIAVPGGLNSGNADGTSFDTPAYNLRENGNDGLLIESGGVNVEGENWPVGFHLQPVQGDWNPPAPWDPAPATERTWDIAAGPAVTLRLEAGDDGRIVYVFDATNIPDGTCE